MKIALIAGEASGDMLAAELMSALKQRHPGIEFIGMGGPLMQAQGLRSFHDYSALSLMGLVEVLKHLPALLKLRRQLLAYLLEQKPDMVIGVDAPDFNLGLEKRCKRAGLSTLHFVSPSIWAWRQGRAAKMAECCEQVLCLFPMEPEIYARYGMPATFVGHPLADRIALLPDSATARLQTGANAVHTLAVLPGSRLSEISRLLPVFLDAAQRLRDQLPDLQLLIPAANRQCREAIQAQVAERLLENVIVLDGQAQAAMMACDAVLLASGTAALEAMLCKKPMVVAYKISPITHFIVRTFKLLKVDQLSLPNALAGFALVPELMQENCNAAAIAEALQPLLHDARDNQTLLQRFTEIHLELRRDAAARAAEVVLQCIAAKH
jgi:lipid-A-disaccharide synthase